MTTILDIYKNLTYGQIIDQITLLETIDFSNSMKIYRNKVKDNTAKVIRKVWGNTEKDSDNKEIKAGDTYKILEENRKKLVGLSRQELDIKLKLLLCDKAESDIEYPEEIISLDIINESIKLLNIDDHLTPAQKTDKIYAIYSEKIIDYWKRNFNKDSINDENKIINIEDIHIDIKFLIDVITESIKSWDIIHGYKKIDREVLTQSIWFSILNYGKKFTPSVEELPSRNLSLSQEDMIKEDDWFFKLKSNYKKAINKLDENEINLMDLENEIDKIKKSLGNKKYNYTKMEDARKQFNKEIKDIEAELIYDEKTIELLETEVGYISEKIELKDSKVSNRYNEMKKELNLKKQKLKDIRKELIDNTVSRDGLIEEIRNDNRVISDKIVKTEYLQEEIKRLKEIKKQSEKEYLEDKEVRYKKLDEIWKLYFTNIQIHPQFIKEVVEYRFNDRLEIEKVIKELYEAQNPSIIAENFRQKDKNDNYYIDIILNKYRQVRLEYKLEENDDVKITLIRIYHGEKID